MGFCWLLTKAFFITKKRLGGVGVGKGKEEDNKKWKGRGEMGRGGKYGVLDCSEEDARVIEDEEEVVVQDDEEGVWVDDEVFILEGWLLIKMIFLWMG